MSSIFIIVSIIIKKKGKVVKKSWFVVPLIILVVNILIAMIPVGYITFLRIANNMSAEEIIYAESGKAIYWPMDGKTSNTNWFEMDNMKYIPLQDSFLGKNIFINTSEDKRAKPLANIRHSPKNTNTFNDAMIFLLTGSINYRLDVSTIYPLINENNFDIYEVNGTAGSGIFCLESNLDSINGYYNDTSNYDMQNISCEYSLYSDKQGSGERNNTPYINVKKEITLAPKVFEELNQVYFSEQKLEHVEISQKYNELDKEAKPGTPIFGYPERVLISFSKDEMAYRNVYLVLLEGNVYVEYEASGNYINGYPLTDEMNQYIKDTVFND